jgi:hypothetical protein
MGYPLRKLHQIHSIASVPLNLMGSCNIRTTGSRGAGAAQAHGSTGLCVKKLASRKAGSRTVGRWSWKITVLYNLQPINNSPVRHFAALWGGLYEARQSRSRAFTSLHDRLKKVTKKQH